MPRKRRYWNPRANQKINRTTGKFMRKAGSKTPTPPVVASGDLLDHLKQYADPRVLAKRIDKLARQGDGAMLALLIQAAARTQASDAAQQYDLSVLLYPELTVFRVLLKKVMRQTLDASDIEVLDRINNPAPQAEAAQQEEQAEEEAEVDVLFEFKRPESAPAPAPVKPPTPPRSRHLDYLPSDENLARSQPSTGGRRRSLVGSMSNDAMSRGGYDDPADDYDFAIDPNNPPAPNKKAN